MPYTPTTFNSGAAPGIDAAYLNALEAAVDAAVDHLETVTGNPHALIVDDLDDVVITGIADDDVLSWDSGTSKWVNSPAASGMPVGFLAPTAGPSTPAGWLLCDGTSYATATYPALFAEIGYTYGGAGANFNVPDYRDRMIVGVSGTKALGSTGGAATVTLTGTELPAHTHTGPSHSHTGPSHTHTGPSHTHAVGTLVNAAEAAHTHAGPSHTHTGPSHTHTGPSHTHAVGTLVNAAEASHTHSAALGVRYRQTNSSGGSGLILLRRREAADGYDGEDADAASGTTGAGASHNHAISGSTAAEGTGATGASGTAATGADGTGATAAGSSHNHAISGATAAEGTGATGASGTGATGTDGTGASGSTGSGIAFSIQNPYGAARWMIKT